ncbi:MAG: thioredoxin [Candidatus Omnitrophica bacterium]|nr:thioredoxin [Candidatus Omnitrophota bacterium]
MAAIEVNDKSFEKEVLKADTPVLVDFWAEWCGPCKMISPIIDDIAGDLAGKLKVVKVNVDESQELAGQYNVMSIPTLLIFKKGSPVEQVIGAMGKDQLMEKISPHIA